MTALSQRERSLALMALFVLLFSIVGFTARGRVDRWRTTLAARREAEAERQRMAALIDQQHRWEQSYAEMKDLLPVFTLDRQVDTYWLGLIDRLAARHGVNILRRQARAEQAIGDVFELPIEVRDWDGSLEALLRFLHDLQNEGAMLDVRHLVVRPREAGNPAVLRGQFTIYCAYLRAETPVAGNTTRAEG